MEGSIQRHRECDLIVFPERIVVARSPHVSRGYSRLRESVMYKMLNGEGTAQNFVGFKPTGRIIENRNYASIGSLI